MQHRPPSTDLSRMSSSVLTKEEDPASLSPRRDRRGSAKPKNRHNKSTSADVELKLAEPILRRGLVDKEILITKEELSSLEKNSINQLLDEPSGIDYKKKPRRDRKEKDDLESVTRKRHKSRPVARSHSNKEDSTQKEDVDIDIVRSSTTILDDKRKERKPAKQDLPLDKADRKPRAKARPTRKTSDKSNASNSGGEGKSALEGLDLDDYSTASVSSPAMGSERKTLSPRRPATMSSRNDEAHSTSDNEDDLVDTMAGDASPSRSSSNPAMEGRERPPKGDDSDDDTASFFANYDDRRHRLSTSSISRLMGTDASESESLESSVASVIRSPLSNSRQHSRSRVRSVSEDQFKQQDERIRINVGGRIFESYASTLRKYPNTLLGTMLHPRNARLLKLNQTPGAAEDLFFDRNPRVFEVILDFYRTGQLNRPHDLSLEMLKEELAFFQIELPEHGFWNKRISMELIKLEYKNILLPAEEYRKMTRHKLLSEHIHTIVRVLDFIQQKIERKARSGHNSCTITFYSPLHYTNNTPNEIFKTDAGLQEIRDMLVELLRSKDFTVKETNEYSKTKATSIIGLHDQVVNYNDPKFFAFQIKW